MSQLQARLLSAERDRYIDNLLSLYRSADPADLADGFEWYPRAHAIVCDWAETYQRSIANVAAVVSALSPQCSWDRNLVAAAELLAGGTPTGHGPIYSNVDKAIRLLDSGSHDIGSVFKCAPKVASFACNLAGVYDVVTVDTHAAQALRNDVLSTDRLTLPLYSAMASIYAESAAHARVLPATFQAVCWLAWKRLYPTRDKIARRSRY